MFNYDKKQSGLSLIELLVVLAIIGILTSVGVPSYNKFVQEGEFSEAFNGMHNVYRFGRSEAIKTSTKMQYQTFDKRFIVFPILPGNNYDDSIAVGPIFDETKLHVSWDPGTIQIKANGSIPQNSHYKIVDRRNGKTLYLCILRNGQSYKSKVACEW